MRQPPVSWLPQASNTRSGRGCLVSPLAPEAGARGETGQLLPDRVSDADFNALRRRFLADLSKTKRPLSVRILAARFREAERLLRHHGLTVRLRTLDVLQLAVAQDLQGRGVLTHFVCADRDLLSVAAAEGLSVLDPKNP